MPVMSIPVCTCDGSVPVTGQFLWREYGLVPEAGIRVNTCGGYTGQYLCRVYGSVPVAGIRVSAYGRYTGTYSIEQNQNQNIPST